MPGISATASAAACARRFESPMTNCSKVWRGLKPAGWWARDRRLRGPRRRGPRCRLGRLAVPRVVPPPRGPRPAPSPVAGVGPAVARGRSGGPVCGAGAAARAPVPESRARRVERRDELDVDVGPEHGRGAHLEQPAEAVGDPAPGLVGGLDQERAVVLARGERLEPLMPRRVAERPVGARRGSVARTMRARDRTRTRGRASSAYEETAADGDGRARWGPAGRT